MSSIAKFLRRTAAIAAVLCFAAALPAAAAGDTAGAGEIRWETRFVGERTLLFRNGAEFDFRACLADQLRRHRAMKAEDALKQCFQAAFGPEHILDRTDAARQRFDAAFAAVAPRPGQALHDILSPDFINAFPLHIINIHHSFFPAFAGARPYYAAHARGVKIIGATAHYATENLDEGPIIAQDVTPVSHRGTPADWTRLGADLEKIVLARAVSLHLSHRILVYKNRTIIF